MAFLTSYFSGDINETHGLPINTEPTSPPHLYQGPFRDIRMSNSEGDHRVSLRGRKGFSVCPSGQIFHKEWDVELGDTCGATSIVGAEYDVVDMRDIGSARYLLMHTKDKRYGYLFKLCMPTCGDCDGTTEGCCGEDLGAPQQFEINNCTSEKIEVVSMPRGEGTEITGSIKNVIIGTSVFGLFCPKDTRSDLQNCFITIDECGENGYSGQSREIVGLQDGCYLMDAPRQGISDNISIEEIQSLTIENLQTSNDVNNTEELIEYINGLSNQSFNEVQEVKDVTGVLRCDYGEVPVIATTTGLYYDQYDGCQPYPNCAKLACFGNTFNSRGVTITSTFMYDGQFGYLTDRGFVFLGGFGLNNGFFSVENTLEVGSQFDLAVPFGGIVMLFSGEQMGYIYRNGDQTTGIAGVGYEFLGNIGYLTRCAVDENLGSLYMIGSDKELYQIGVQYTGDNVFGAVQYKPTLQNISNYIRDRIKAVDLCKGDKVCLNVDNQRIQLFLGSKSGKLMEYINDLGEVGVDFVRNPGTIILNFEIYHQYRHMWLVCNEEICNKYKGCYYGDTIFNYEGCLDGAFPVNKAAITGEVSADFVYINGRPYRQQIGMYVIDNPAGGNTSGLFSEFTYDDIAFIMGDEWYKAGCWKQTDYDITIDSSEGFPLPVLTDLGEIEYEGSTVMRTHVTHCGKEKVESYPLEDLCFCTELDKKNYKDVQELTLDNIANIEASEEMLCEDIYNIGGKPTERCYGDIGTLCECDPLIPREILTCLEENDCDCDGMQKEFKSCEYVRYGRRAVVNVPVNGTGNMMYVEVEACGGDMLHVVAMGVEIGDEVVGFGKCGCNTVTGYKKALHKVCKERIHENTSARE